MGEAQGIKEEPAKAPLVHNKLEYKCSSNLWCIMNHLAVIRVIRQCEKRKAKIYHLRAEKDRKSVNQLKVEIKVKVEVK